MDKRLLAGGSSYLSRFFCEYFELLLCESESRAECISAYPEVRQGTWTLGASLN